MARTKDVVLMATVTSFEGIEQPGRNELRQFAELFEPVFKASSMEARRNSIAALSRCPVLPKPVTWFIASQPIALAAIFLTRSPAIDDDTLIAIARAQGPLHAKAIAARDNLSVKVVDALVSLHSGHEITDKVVDPIDDALAREQGFAIDPSETLRQTLKALVHRDTLAMAQEQPDAMDETSIALLVRFARLRETRAFSMALAEALNSSRWLSERILLDLSGQQLATALIALELSAHDGAFVLAQIYPHLGAPMGETSRAAALWQSLDPDRCRERVAAWIRADDYTLGKDVEEDKPANHNAAVVSKAGATPLFGRRRA